MKARTFYDDTIYNLEYSFEEHRAYIYSLKLKQERATFQKDSKESNDHIDESTTTCFASEAIHAAPINSQESHVSSSNLEYVKDTSDLPTEITISDDFHDTIELDERRNETHESSFASSLDHSTTVFEDHEEQDHLNGQLSADPLIEDPELMTPNFALDEPFESPSKKYKRFEEIAEKANHLDEPLSNERVNSPESQNNRDKPLESPLVKIRSFSDLTLIQDECLPDFLLSSPKNPFLIDEKVVDETDKDSEIVDSSGHNMNSILSPEPAFEEIQIAYDDIASRFPRLFETVSSHYVNWTTFPEASDSFPMTLDEFLQNEMSKLSGKSSVRKSIHPGRHSLAPSAKKKSQTVLFFGKFALKLVKRLAFADDLDSVYLFEILTYIPDCQSDRQGFVMLQISSNVKLLWEVCSLAEASGSALITVPFMTYGFGERHVSLYEYKTPFTLNDILDLNRILKHEERGLDEILVLYILYLILGHNDSNLNYALTNFLFVSNPSQDEPDDSLTYLTNTFTLSYWQRNPKKTTLKDLILTLLFDEGEPSYDNLNFRSVWNDFFNGIYSRSTIQSCLEKYEKERMGCKIRTLLERIEIRLYAD